MQAATGSRDGVTCRRSERSPKSRSAGRRQLLSGSALTTSVLAGAVAALALAACATSARADACGRPAIFWIVGSGDFSNPNNFQMATGGGTCAPEQTDNVVFGSSPYPTAGTVNFSGSTVNSLLAGGDFTFNITGSMTVTTGVNSSGGVLTIEGGASSTFGGLNATSLTIPDNTSLSISGPTQITSLTANGGASLSLTSSLNVRNLTLSNSSMITVTEGSAGSLVDIDSGTIDHAAVTLSGGPNGGVLNTVDAQAGQTLSITDGARVSAGQIYYGLGLGGTVNVTGGATQVTAQKSTIYDTLSVTQNASVSTGALTDLGLLDIESGGQVTSTTASLADHGGLVLNLTGQNSQWTVNGDLKVDFAQGTVNAGAVLHVLGGGAISIAPSATNANATSTASLSFNGAGTRLDATGDATVGGQGAGTLSFTAGTSGVIGGALVLGDKEGGDGTVSLQGANVSLKLTGDTTIGNAGDGVMTLAGGAGATLADVIIGAETPAGGGAVDPATNLHTDHVSSLSIDGGGTLQTNALTIGKAGFGAMTIKDATVDTSDAASIAEEDGGEGQVTLNDANAKWSTGDLTVGGAGTAVLTISQGTVTTSGEGAIGDESGGTGTVDVDGAAASWTISGGLTVGGGGTGTLTLENGAAVTVGGAELVIGDAADSNGSVTLDGASTQLNFAATRGQGDMTIGKTGTGVFALQDGARFTTNAITVGDDKEGSGTLNVLGSRLEVLQDFVDGSNGHGALNLSQQAVVQADGDLTLSDLSTGGGTVSLDQKSSLTVAGTLSIGHEAQASITIQGGSLVQTAGDKVELGELDGGTGVVTLQGTDGAASNPTPSTLTATGTVLIGDVGAGEIDISQGALLHDTSAGGGLVELGAQAGRMGTLKVDGTGSLFQVTRLTVAGTTGAAGGTGAVTLTHGGQGAIGAELDSWDGSTLSVDSTSSLTVGSASAPAGGAVTVGAGGTWSGTGSLHGDLDNQGLVEIAHAASGALSISGAYTQGASGTLSIEINPMGASQLHVGGAASLNGALDLLFDPGTYAAKTYTLIQAGSVAGTFATVSGTAPSGFTDSVSYNPTNVQLDLAASGSGVGSGGSGGGGSGGGSTGGSGGGSTITGDQPELSGSSNRVIGAGGATVGGDNASTVYTGVLSGSGSLTKTGTGALVFNGQETYTGATTISGGTLQIGDADHTAASIQSPITVDAGGTLSGHGAIDGDVDNPAGTVQPGGSIGDLTINGAFTQGASGVLAIEVSPTAASRLIVTGAASINGTLKLIYDPGTYHPARFTVLSAASVTGTFATVTGSVPTAGLGQSISYSNTAVSLDITQSGPVVVAPTNDAVLASPASLAVAYAQDAEDVILDHVGAIADEPSSGLSGGRGTGGSFGEAAGALPGMIANSGGWVVASGDLFAVNNAGPTPGFHASGGAITAGMDGAVGSDGRIGLAVGYSHADLDQSAGGDGALDTGRIAVYGGLTAGSIELRALAGYAHVDIATSRLITDVGVAAEHHGANEADVAFEAHMTVRWGVYGLTPLAGMRYTHVSEAKFSETGASGFDLTGLAHATDSVRPFVGATLERTDSLANGGALITSVHVGYEREALSGFRGLTVASTDGTRFGDQGLEPARDTVRAGVGLSLRRGPLMRLRVGYDAILPTGNVAEQSFSAGFSLRF